MVQGIWDQFLQIIKEEAGSRVVETWFKAVSLSQWDSASSTVHLQAPNPFVRDWLKSNYLSLIQLHLGRLLNVSGVRVIFADSADTPEQVTETFTVIPAKVLPATQKKKHELVATFTSKKRTILNSNYIFNSFIVGPSNELSYAAAQAVADKPGKLYNPLFIYGESGLGKTHLLHAIGNEIKKQYPKASILYQTAARFVNEFIHSIRFDKVHKFQAKYKHIDVLLVDDIQFISNKEQTQEAFFHIFNSLYESHKQIVFSSDTFPQDITGLAERLRSRLASGLVTDMRMPTLETKIAIIKKKADLHEAHVPDEVAHFVASRVTANIRELEGSLIRVMAFASLTKQEVTLPLAQKVLLRGQESKKHAVDFERIIKCVEKHYAYSLGQLQSKSRSKELSLVRQLTMFLMKKLTDKSLRDIGIFLGGRDHSTVMHALNKVNLYKNKYPEFLTKLENIEREIVR